MGYVLEQKIYADVVHGSDGPHLGIVGIIENSPTGPTHALIGVAPFEKKSGMCAFFALARTQIPEMVSDVIAKVPSLPIYLME